PCRPMKHACGRQAAMPFFPSRCASRTSSTSCEGSWSDRGQTGQQWARVQENYASLGRSRGAIDVCVGAENDDDVGVRITQSEVGLSSGAHGLLWDAKPAGEAFRRIGLAAEIDDLGSRVVAAHGVEDRYR